MFCDNCGEKIPDDSKYCGHCGNRLKTVNNAVNEKNMLVALFLSIFLPALGLCYTGNKKTGIILFAAILITHAYGYVSVILLAVSWILWVYAVYETYREVKIANGENPNLIEDIQNLPNYEYIVPILVIAILMIVYYFIINLIMY